MAELASAFPRTGGLYVFLRETFSPLAGFLWGWAMFWSMHTGIIAAIATVFARYAAHFVAVGGTGIRLIAVGVILALSALNYVGVRAGSRVQTALTIAKVLAIAFVVLAGLILAAPDLDFPTGLEIRDLTPTGRWSHRRLAHHRRQSDRARTDRGADRVGDGRRERAGLLSGGCRKDEDFRTTHDSFR